MPSIKNIVMGFALFATLTSALPAQGPPSGGSGRGSGSSPGGPASAVKATSTSTPTMPLSGDAVELPAPTLAFAYAAVGRGIQNYSCSAVGAAPVSIGAIATLYDATSLAESDMTSFNALPGQAVKVAEGANGCFELPAANKNMALLGHHYFLADGTPTFNLTGVGKQIEAGKNASISAPTTAPTGPNGSTAVAWLQLNAKPAPYTSIGIGQAYRVQTAGGNPPATCASTAVISVQYAAQYWFFD